MSLVNNSGVFFSCDWGTTSFRLRLARASDCKVLREMREPKGIKSIHDEAAQNGCETEAARAPFFARFLRSQIETLLETETRPSPLPLVISGMASSTIGWKQLPYARTPFQLDGRGLRIEEIEWDKPTSVSRTYLVSGVATADDMMRGEETEIVGLMMHPSRAAWRKRSILVLPGTHSKHVTVENEAVVDFHTYMTGELFDVLGKHSILRASVDICSSQREETHSSAFLEGVRNVRQHGLAASLFSVRTRAVLGGKSPAENTSFLSGILIGAEVSDLLAKADRPIIVAAASELGDMYESALQALTGARTPSSARDSSETGPAWFRIPSNEVAHATISAHAQFLQNLGAT